VIEAAGIATVSLSMIPEFTASVGAPRVAGIEYPFGRPLGLPGDPDGQRTVLHAALDVVSRARAPGTVIQLPFRWPQSPRDARADPPVPPPIVQLLKHKPWLLPRFLRHDIPEPQEPGN
jgi:D-proline reductase (dithiol) PrdB